MSDKNTNLPAEQEEDFVSEAEEMLIESIMEEVGPKLKNLIKPGKKFLLRHLGDDEKMLIIRRIKGTKEIVLLEVDMRGVSDDFEIEDDYMEVHPLEMFINMLAGEGIGKVTGASNLLEDKEQKELPENTEE